MQIRWLGHACFEFALEGDKIVTDPHDGKSIGLKPPVTDANIVLVSHDHYDHNAVSVVRGTHIDLKSGTGVNHISSQKIIGYPAFHDEEKGSLRGLDTIYQFESEGIRICHVGDLGDFPEPDVIDAIRGVDLLFVPVGEVYTMPIPKMKKFIEMVNPKITVPMHYKVKGLNFQLEPVTKFLKTIDPSTVTYVGNEVSVTRDDLDDASGYWVFDL